MKFAGSKFWKRATPVLRHSRTRSIAIWLVAIVAGFGILVGLAAPPLLRSKLASVLTERFHRQVTIEQIRINPYALTVTVRGFLMKERQGDQAAVSFEELRLNLQATSLFRWGLVVKEFRLVKPYVNLIRNEDRSYNYQDLIKEFTSGPPSPSGPPPRFSLNNIEIVDGKIDFDDRPEKTKHTISAIRIGVPFISSLPSQVDVRVRPAFSAVVNGAPLEISGETKPFAESQESVFRLDIDNLEIAKYLEYSPVELNFKVPSGKLHSRLMASFTHFGNKPPALSISGNVVLQELKMVNKGDGSLLALPAFATDLEALEPFAGKATIKAIKATGLEIHVQRSRGGDINLANLIEKSAPPANTEPEKPATEKPATPFIYRIAEVVLDEGKVYFSDETPKEAYKTRLDKVQLDIKELTNEPGKKASLNLSLDTDSQEHISHAGELQLTPLLLTGKVEIAALRLGGFRPYYEETFAGEIREGTLDFSTAYSVNQQNDRTAIKLSELNVAVRNLRLNEQGRRDDLSRLPVLAVKDTTVDLENRSILIGRVEGENGSAFVRRNADGSLNLGRLVKSAPAEPKAPQPAKSDAAPWKFEVGQIALDRFKLGYEDLGRPTPAKINLSEVSLRADKLTNGKNQRGKITFQTRINEKGVLRLAGSAGINPARGDFVVESRDVEVLPFQPYLEDQVNFILTGGRLGAKGKLTFDASDPGPLKLTYGGSAQAAEFAAVEKASSDDLLKFKSLNLDSIEFALEPMQLRIGDITLSDFYSRIIIAADGKINLQNLTVKKEDADSTPAQAKPVASPAQAAAAPPPEGKPATAPPPVTAASPAPEKPVTIGKITLHGGQINFSDFFIKPNYSANLMSVEGTISELKPETPGDINLQAKLDNAAPVDINGKINPLSQELYLDIVADARDIELSPFTPYSAKYVGYGIEKGKLSFNVKYKLENRKLDAQNQIILNQLTFGEKIESPTATKLPVLLAVALLKDRNGVIDINLPISGSLDEPEFSVGGIILKLVLNIITKAVTSPFALLGSLFGGGGEELSFVEFDYGRATVTPAAEAKLKTLATAMNNRPALKLEISPRVDAVNDLEGLRKTSVERKVKAQKFKELARRGDPPTSVDDVQVAGDEYERYLKAAYGAENFPKPRNVIGLAKDLPVPEMEALMLKYTQIGDDDLRDLANRRAQIVRDRLLSSGQVTSDRVFIVAAKTEAAGDKAKARSSRVDFSLR